MSQDIVSPTKPDFFKYMMDLKKSGKKPTKLTKRDEKFALLAQSDGWEEFKQFCKARIENLMSLRDFDASGKDLSELGLRFLVADLVSGEIEKIITRVDQAKELYDQERKDN